VQLVVADFSEADLLFRFHLSYLSRRRLHHDNVTEANFDKANLIDLWLKGVYLSQALNLTPDQIESAEIDKATQLPAYIEITWKGADNSKAQKTFEKKPNGKKQ
jgi:uncharacterized protein YjbI with pentapeptide repeats